MSGLDAYQAEQVVQALRDLSREGCTVVCVIHQPSGKVFSLFDDFSWELSQLDLKNYRQNAMRNDIARS